MQQNILRESDITKIFLQYVENGVRKRFSVKLRFMDSKECYFAAELPIKFQKPKNKTVADLVVYTIDGVYKTSVKIFNTSVSLPELIFEVTIPVNWNYIQLRKSTRKTVELPVHLKFNDGFEITATSVDLALGGVAFKYNSNLSSIYTRFAGIITIELPKELVINLPDSKLITEGKFVREINNDNDYNNEHIYAFQFMNITDEQLYVLTNYLIKLN